MAHWPLVLFLFVFFVIIEMVMTNTTPKTEYRRCSMCSETTKEGFKQHIMVCAKRAFQFLTCDYINARELNDKRHIKRSHPGLQPNDDMIKLGPNDQSKKKQTTQNQRPVTKTLVKRIG